MKFSYVQYRFINYYIPLALLMFLIIIAIPSILNTVKSFINCINGRIKVIEFLPRCLFSGIILILMFCVALNPLIHGGFHLREEFETDSVSSSGVIEKIRVLDVFSGQKYKLENKTTFGVRIWIDGTVFTLMDSGNLYIGEKVGFTYLPKSHIILEIWDSGTGLVGDSRTDLVDWETNPRETWDRKR